MVEWPWSKPQQPASPAVAPIQPATPQQPVLLAVVVEPVKYKGDAIRHKLIMRFSTGDIVIGQADNGDALSVLAGEIREELGMDVP